MNTRLPTMSEQLELLKGRAISVAASLQTALEDIDAGERYDQFTAAQSETGELLQQFDGVLEEDDGLIDHDEGTMLLERVPNGCVACGKAIDPDAPFYPLEDGTRECYACGDARQRADKDAKFKAIDGDLAAKVGLTRDTLHLLALFAKDAPNWSDHPYVGDNFTITPSLKGNLTDLKQKGLITTQYDEDAGMDYVTFTDAGKIVARIVGFPIGDES